MGVEIKVTDKELPVSPVFIEFLSRHIDGSTGDGAWHDQLAETLVPAEREQRLKYAQSVADAVLQHPLGQRAIYRAYDLLAAIMIGTRRRLAEVQERFRFICVVGCPRHGGTFLTKELFRAVGRDPAAIPAAIAHDGFPDLSPFSLHDGVNGHTAMAQQLAEYLAMVEVFFEDGFTEDGRIVVPKKATKAAYHGAFLGAVLGPETEYIITLRHPLAACISTYEKSSGLPPGGRFAARSNIEEWALRDNVFLGFNEAALARSDYLDVYLRYWEAYHYNLALSGLPRRRNWRSVAYGRERIMALAGELRRRFGAGASPDSFVVFNTQDRHPDWRRKAEAAVHRVAAVWDAAGLRFPLDELMEGW